MSDERGPLGKADANGSCAGLERDWCGGQSDGACWCDEQCAAYGDCCDDYEPVCVEPDPEPAPLTCTDDAECGADMCLLGICQSVVDQTIERDGLGLQHPNVPPYFSNELFRISAHWSPEAGLIIGGSVQYQRRSVLDDGVRGIDVRRDEDGAWTGRALTSPRSSVDAWRKGELGGLAGLDSTDETLTGAGFVYSTDGHRETIISHDVEFTGEGNLAAAVAVLDERPVNSPPGTHDETHYRLVFGDEVQTVQTVSTPWAARAVALHLRDEQTPDLLALNRGTLERWRKAGFEWRLQESTHFEDSPHSGMRHAARDGVTHVMLSSSNAERPPRYVRVTGDALDGFEVDALPGDVVVHSAATSAAGHAYFLATHLAPEVDGHRSYVVEIAPNDEISVSVVGLFDGNGPGFRQAMAAADDGTLFIVTPESLTGDFNLRTITPATK